MIQKRRKKKSNRVGVRAGRSRRDRATGAQDEAGPSQAIPQPGASWQPEGYPATQPHEYQRGGTAKLLTLFRPSTGQVRAKGVIEAPNAVLHPWLQEQLSTVLAEIEEKQPTEVLPSEEERPLYALLSLDMSYPPL